MLITLIIRSYPFLSVAKIGFLGSLRLFNFITNKRYPFPSRMSQRGTGKLKGVSSPVGKDPSLYGATKDGLFLAKGIYALSL